MSQPAASRASAPRPDTTRPFQFPKFSHLTLANGLQLYLAHYDRGPLVHISVALVGGGQFDQPDKAGRTSLAGSLLDEGTQQHSSVELAERVERLGGYLATYADWDSMSASIGALSANLGEGMSLLSEIVTGATVPDHEVERVRKHRLAELQRRRAQPGARASETLARSIYGTTAYGSPLQGSDETIRDLGREDLVACIKNHATPEGASIIAVGDIDTNDLVARVEENMGDWRGAPKLSPPSLEFESPAAIRIHLIDRPDSPQTELRLGHIGLSRTHPDFVALQVMNSLLGGKFTSRINLKLREELGITYGASTGFASRLGPGPFVVSSSVSTDSAGIAVEEVLNEIRRLQDEPVENHELEETKSYLLGVFPYTLQSIEGLASRLAELAIYSLPDDYYDKSLELIGRVDVKRISSLARQYLHPEKINVVAVGPAVELEPQLSRIAAVEVEPFDQAVD